MCEIDADGNETSLSSVYQNYSGTGINQYCSDPIRLTAGIYIIHVKNRYSEQADLTIKYTEEDPSTSETEKNNSFSDANVIDLNKEYNANIQNSTDEDYYKFELAQEGSLYVNLRNTGTIEKRWKVELYNEKNNGNRELINSWYNTTNKNSRFTKYRFPKGVYYIKVSGEGFGYYNECETGDYSIGTVYVAETKDKSEIEYNDSFETANIINVNNEYTGNIATDKDIDYYTFTLEEDSDVSVQLKQENDEITNCLYKVILYRKNDDGIFVVYDSFLSDSKTLSTGSDISIPAGKYYLCVKNNNGTPEDKNDYKIKINQQKAKEAVTLHGSPKDVAGQSGTPVAVNSTVVVNDKENRVIFNIAKSGYVSLNAIPHRYEYGVKGYIALYRTDADENEIEVIGRGTWNRGGGYESVDAINTDSVLLNPGTYIVECEDISQAVLTINYEEIADLSESKIAAISDQTYIGEGIAPKLSITYKGRTLVENRDYTVVYSNNISVGTASVVIKSVEGASVGSNQTSFKILKREISVPVAQQSEFVYDNTEKQLIISNEDIKYLIVENDRATNAGTYKASYNIDTSNCVWKDKRNEPVQIEWTIKKANARISIDKTAYEKELEDGTFTLEGITTDSDGVIACTVTEGTDVITVNEAGLVTILKPGNAVISVKVKESSNYKESLEKTINVVIKANPAGSKIKISNAYFEVTASSGLIHTVEFIEPDKNSYTSYTIPTTVTSHSGEVFIVTAVSEKAFYNNKKLKQVTIPNTIKTIGSNAFSGCNNLTKVKVGAGVETIGESAFKNCTKLTSITLPKTVTKIEKNTFNGCKKLKNITIKSNKVIKIGTNAFKGVSNKCVIKVPRKLVKKYKKVLTKKTGFKKGMKIKKI